MSRVQRVPLRIGVTGHRDLDPADVDHIRKTVEGLLVQLRRRLPGIHVELVTAPEWRSQSRC